MTKKRIISALLLMAMLTSPVLTACSERETETEENTTSDKLGG